MRRVLLCASLALLGDAAARPSPSANEPNALSAAASDAAAVGASAWAPSLGSLLAAADSHSPQQLIFLDRHIEKNGGGSMSYAMHASAECGARTLGYSILEKEWSQLALDLANGSTVVCIDAHSPVPDDWLQRARRVAAAATPPARLLTTLRVRSPPAHYRSFYAWDQQPRMDHGWSPRISLVEWVAQTPDLQAGILNHSYYAEQAQHRQLATTAPLSDDACEALLETARSVDLLTTTEAIGEMWPLLRRLTGVALPAADVHEPPKIFTDNPTPVHAARLAEDELDRATRRVAPCDWRLYELAQARTRELLDAWRAVGGRRGGGASPQR